MLVCFVLSCLFLQPCGHLLGKGWPLGCPVLCFHVFCHFPNVFLSSSELRARLVLWNWFRPSSKIFLLTVPRRYFFCGSFVLYMSCVCHAFVSVHCCLVVTCWESWPFGSLFVMFNCVFDTFPCGILGQLWYLIVSVPDLCRLSYFEQIHMKLGKERHAVSYNKTIGAFFCGIH